MIRDPAQTGDSIISAPVIRAPVEDEYPRWLAATVSRVTSTDMPPAYPNVLYMQIPGPYVRRLPILPPSSQANSKQRARRRGFLIIWNHQEFWRSPPVVGGPAHALIWLLGGDSGATQCGASPKSCPATWNGRSTIWRHNTFSGAARCTTKTLELMRVRPSPQQNGHCKPTY